MSRMEATTFKRYLRRAATAFAATVVALVALFSAGVLWPTERLEPVRTDMPLAIVGVAVVDARAGRVTPKQTVVVEEFCFTQMDILD